MMEHNIIEFDRQTNIRFVVERHIYEREAKGGNVLKESAIIVLKNFKSGKEMIHPFTDFLWEKYRSLKIKSQIDHGRMITVFLNDILVRPNKYKIKSFDGLNYDNAADFLNYYCANLSRETAIRYMNEIGKFFYFLTKRKILKESNLKDYTVCKHVIKKGIIQESVIAPFYSHVDLPDKTVKGRNEHDMMPELQGMFLEVAYEEVNRIVFGVALQMFAGLRMGEVINLTYSALRTIGPYGRYGLAINVKDRDLRSDLKNNQGKGYSKRNRHQQAISPFGIIEILLKKHRNKYRSNDGSDAIFINANGKAISYESYRYYFRMLKNRFLTRMKESNNPILKAQFLVLSSKRWFSHIGRGIFSNNLIETVDNISEFQVKRGDLSIESGEVYVCDSRRLGLKFEENTEEVFSNLVDKFRDRV